MMPDVIRTAADREEVQNYVAAVRKRLEDPDLQKQAAAAATQLEGSGPPAQQISAALPDQGAGPPSSGGLDPDTLFMSRDPAVSLLQSSLESKLREQGAPEIGPLHRGLIARIVHFIDELIHPVKFGPEDPEWVVEIAKSMLERLAAGNHKFNPEPARHEIGDAARLVVVGDWGSGIPRAAEVATFMAEEVGGALAAGREVHVVHLGDVYYSGTPEEYKRNVLAPGMWPVTDAQARAGVTSWSLNGNHDMYGGGYGYFKTLLADPRFAAQHSPDGKPTSWFHIVTPSWDLIGLDSSWDPDVLADGHFGVLEDPQAEFVAGVANASDRKLMLLSHHQMVSVYDRDSADVPRSPLVQKLKPTLDSGAVDAWLWGHEHRCVGYEEAEKVKFPRCIGHGGVPVLMGQAPDEANPPPSIWEDRGFREARGDRWARFGFAVLDFDGPRFEVRYRDEKGEPSPHSPERFPAAPAG